MINDNRRNGPVELTKSIKKTIKLILLERVNYAGLMSWLISPVQCKFSIIVFSSYDRYHLTGTKKIGFMDLVIDNQLNSKTK